MNLLYTVNIGNFITSKARDSFLSACARWGCNYAEITTTPIVGCPSAAKLTGYQCFSGHDAIAYFDGDMIISDTAPNPFTDEIEPGTLYAVSDYQKVNQCPEWDDIAYGPLLADLLSSDPHGNSFPTKQNFFNSGMFLFRPGAEISIMFGWAILLLKDNATKFQEQAALNFAAHNAFGVSTVMLGEEWNHIIPKGCGPSEFAHVNHFAGEMQSLLK